MNIMKSNQSVWKKKTGISILFLPGIMMFVGIKHLQNTGGVGLMANQKQPQEKSTPRMSTTLSSPVLNRVTNMPYDVNGLDTYLAYLEERYEKLSETFVECRQRDEAEDTLHP